MLPGADKTMAFQVAETLRKKVETNNYGINKKITCSFGVAQYRSNEDVVEFLKNVDTCLYEAKNSGRNCVKHI